MQRGLWLGLTAALATLIGAAAGLYWVIGSSDGKNPSNIEVAAAETRVFKTLTLPNGLTTLLISDSKSATAAAAVNVFAGSWADPADAQGLAHLLEHMLFLGTEKYPLVDEYQAFINQHGGSQNAYTAAENTLYYFDIAADQLAPALDRFAQFFIAPLLDPTFVARELQVVDAEFAASLQQEGRRIADAVREVVATDHPASRLAMGNAATLAIPNLDEQLRDFFRRHYIAQQMSLVVYGPQPIDELAALASEAFAGLRQTPATAPLNFSQPLFNPAELPLLVEVAPRRELRQLQLRFPIAGTATDLTRKPWRYISHLLGHEAQGSLFALLRARGWANALSAGTSRLTTASTSFDINIALTEAGVAAWQEVVELLFSTLALLKQSGVQAWVHDEMVASSELAFQFSEPISAQHTAIMLAERLRHYPATAVLSGPYQNGDFDVAAIQAALAQLNPDNLLLVLIRPDAQTDQRSRFYRTPYRETQLTGNPVASWRVAEAAADIRLPERNPFIPADLSVLPLERPESILYQYDPQIIAYDDHLDVWFEQDDRFRTPKTDIYVRLEAAALQKDVEAQMALQLYLALVNDALSDVGYQAGLAGSGYGLRLVEGALQLRLYGYQDKLPLLLDAVVLELVSHSIDPARFALKRDELLRRLRNRAEDGIFTQAQRVLHDRMLADRVSEAEQIQALARLDEAKLLTQRSQILASSFLTLFIHGNLTEAAALQLAKRVDAVIPQQGNKLSPAAVAKLPAKQFLTLLRLDHADAALLQLHQGENASLREWALFALLAEIINGPYFTELRTKEQLGYSVSAQSYLLNKLPHLLLYVQSPSTDPALLQLYSDRFLTRYGQQLGELDEATFAAYKDGLVNSLNKTEQNFFQLSSRYWRNIRDGNIHFNTQKRLSQAAQAISLDGFRRFYRNQIIGDGNRSLSLHQIGRRMNGDYQQHRSNLVGFYELAAGDKWPEDVQWVQPGFNDLP